MTKFCSLFSSSRGNCTYIGSEHGGILIDCGVSAKKIREALTAMQIDPKSIHGIFVTHEHSDHVSGLRVFASANAIPVYASKGTVDAMEKQGILNGKFPVHSLNGNDTICADFQVRPFPLSHDAKEPTGYRIQTEDGHVLSVATDTGIVTDDILSSITGSDLVLLESNHDIGMLQNGPYPYTTKRRILSDYGHLCNDVCAETAVHLLESGTTRFCLAHLSHENNMPRLAYQTTYSEMEMIGAKEGSDYSLSVVGGTPEMIVL